MNALKMILDLVTKWLNRPKPAVAATPQSKTPPATDPVQFKAWLQAEVAKKGQPPQGYEASGEPGKPNRKTYCNFFVRSVLKTVFQWAEFEHENDDQAGEMVDFMESHPDIWKKLEGNFNYKIKGQDIPKMGPDYETAVKYAAQGCLVVAGWKNPDYPKTAPTGHVCVVAPENQLLYSNKWGRLVALAANVGASNWYGKGMSWAFSEKEPNLYLFLGA
jgi:hypothetical protein